MDTIENQISAPSRTLDDSIYVPLLILTTGAVILSVSILLVGGLLSSQSKARFQQGLPFQNQPTSLAQPQQMGSSGTESELKSHSVYYATSTDGHSWQRKGLIQKEASVPDVVELTRDVGSYKTSDLLVYFVDASTLQGPGSELLSVLKSTDGGKTWGNKATVTVQNKPNKGAAVDPSVVQLSDGRLRLYFFGSEVASGNPGMGTGENTTYSAISSDGITFTVEDGTRYSYKQLTDPEVIYYKNSWYMYFSIGTTSRLAVSSDGLSFSTKEISGNETTGGVPGALAISDGGVRLYGCSGGIATATSPDGTNFTSEKRNIVETEASCDPSVIRRSDGSYFMVYKVVENKS